MRIVVVGLGHVGVVTAAALLRDGHEVVGVETDPEIRALVASGLPPFPEPGVAELLAEGHAANRLSVRASIGDAVDADLGVVCVGTRGQPDGTLDCSGVRAVAREFGDTVRRRASELPPLLVVVRSTMVPGSMRTEVLPELAAAAGEPPGGRYDVAYYPVFTREGSAMADHYAPARTVIGERVSGTAARLLELIAGIRAPRFVTSFEVAELAKMADNSFHALKVAFANEIGRFALKSGLSPGEVFDIFQADTKLNLSAAYLRPGGVFGGPCLPKDVRALAARLTASGVAAPIIGHICQSNAQHAEFLLAEIGRRAPSPARILLVGLSFKAGTNDLRDSPLVDFAQELLNRGYRLDIYDPDLAADVDNVRAELSPAVSAALLAQLPAGGAWELVVVANSTPDALQAITASCPRFHIDRL
jgi:GDP-mannose 6-dehydrogenase